MAVCGLLCFRRCVENAWFSTYVYMDIFLIIIHVFVWEFSAVVNISCDLDLVITFPTPRNSEEPVFNWWELPTATCVHVSLHMFEVVFAFVFSFVSAILDWSRICSTTRCLYCVFTHPRNCLRQTRFRLCSSQLNACLNLCVYDVGRHLMWFYNMRL